MPKVTVWLTSYNHEQFIGESIESILAQTYEDYELIIVDDCSTDNSWDIIQHYAKNDARIRTIRHATNLGSSCLYDSLDEMNGEYVAIAHCDDAWYPTKLEKQVNQLDQNEDVAACFTLVDMIDDEGNLYHNNLDVYSNVFDKGINKTRYEWLRHFFYDGNCLCHPSLLIRKNAYTKMGIITSGLNGLPDFCQWVRLCKKAEIYVIQEKLTKFRVHQDGTNTSGDSDASNIRLHTELWLVAGEYFSLADTKEVLDVFPEAERYVVNGKISQKYALAQIFFSHPFPSYRLLGLQLLYELFQDREQEREIEELYGYTRRRYDADKKKYDIFHMIPDERYLHITAHLRGAGENQEDHRVVTKAYIQNTGTFVIRIDFNHYAVDRFTDLKVYLDAGRYRKFRLHTCECGGKNVEFEPANGVKTEEGDLFFTMNPLYVFKMTEAGILHIEGETEELPVGEVEKFHDQLVRDNAMLQQGILEMKQEKACIEEQCSALQQKYQAIEEHVRALEVHAQNLEKQEQSLKEHVRALQEHTRGLEDHRQALGTHAHALEEEIERMRNTKVWVLRNKILKLLGK